MNALVRALGRKHSGRRRTARSQARKRIRTLERDRHVRIIPAVCIGCGRGRSVDRGWSLVDLDDDSLDRFDVFGEVGGKESDGGDAFGIDGNRSQVALDDGAVDALRSAGAVGDLPRACASGRFVIRRIQSDRYVFVIPAISVRTRRDRCRGHR